MAYTSRSRNQRVGLIVCAAVLLAVACAEGLFRLGAASRIEYLYLDLWHRLADKRHEPRHVALVMIDDPSLNDFVDEPLAFWTPHFATAVATLRAAGAKVIAIDFIFSGSPERWLAKLGPAGAAASRNFDQAFRTQINQGEVLLAGVRVGEGRSVDDFVLPSPDYLIALPNMDVAGHVGLANLRTDADGTVRRFGLADGSLALAQQEGWPALTFAALAAARVSGQSTQGPTWRYGARELSPDEDFAIAFPGPPGTIKPLSFRKLLAPDALASDEVRALAGKVVVIGAGYAGMNDVHSTPYSTAIGSANQLMSGPEIQAAIIETLLSGNFRSELPAPLRVLSFLTLLGLVAWWGLHMKMWRTVVLFAVIAQLGAVAAYVLFKNNVHYPLAHLQIGLVLVLFGLALLRLMSEERERERVGHMFGRYVSPQIVKSLLESSELPELGGQARSVSVLFTDIRNFTTLSERLNPKEVVEFLNTYFERACAVLLREGATIDKFIGDAIMVEFGTPLAQPDHARRALRAAVALRGVAHEFRDWMKARFPDRDLPEFDIGIGIHSGEAVVGNIGSPVRMEYTAIGDTVNVASRLEGMTKASACPILASRATVEAAGEGIRTGKFLTLAVKGRDQEVAAFEILGVVD